MLTLNSAQDPGWQIDNDQASRCWGYKGTFFCKKELSRRDMTEIEASGATKAASSSLTVEMKTPPGDHRPVYLTGNFNQWQAADERFRLEQTAPGHYFFTFSETADLPERLEYKYLRGGWSEVEADRFGNPAPNRLADRHARRLEDQVPRWHTGGRSYDPAFLPLIRVISEQFEIPQLIKTRRIAALLPHDYDRNDKRYPVLYLQDGQNLFDDHAPFGNWAVDKKLAVMTEQGLGDLIVVSIDHAEEERIAEFTPSIQTQLGSGDGKKYVRFLADTLKPYVDRHFRTLPGRAHTGLGGSSMGGLISIYGGLMYPEVYSRLMIFSPSLWVAPHIHFHFINFLEARNMKIYLYAGERESTNMVPNIHRFKEELEKADPQAQVDFKLSVDPNGEHNEPRWGQEFPYAAEWLFFTQN